MQNIVYIEKIDSIIVEYFSRIYVDPHKATDFDSIKNIILDFWPNGDFIEVLEARFDDRISIVNKRYPHIILPDDVPTDRFIEFLLWLENGTQMRLSNINSSNEKCFCAII